LTKAQALKKSSTIFKNSKVVGDPHPLNRTAHLRDEAAISTKAFLDL